MGKSTDKTKVLYVITKSNWGGAQRYVYDLATGLPREQFEAVVALGGSGALIQKLHEQHIRVLPIFSLTRDVNTLSDIFAFFELWSIFRSEKPDVVHLNSAKASGLGALAARLAGVPRIIFTAHGWAFNEDRPIFSRMAIKILSWVTVLLSHKTIAVSEAVHHDTKKWLFVQNKVVTIHNGVDSAEFPLREEARSYLFAHTSAQIPKDALIIGTIAELHKNKGLPYAIEAFATLSRKYPSLYYFILGDGEEKNKLDALVQNKWLQGRVLLLGFVENAANYLKAFDVFLLPSTKEGLPYVLLEAGLARLPVIATSVGGIPEIIEHGKTGLLVHSRNTSALARTIEWVSKNSAERTMLGAVLHDKVVKDFSLVKMTAETIALYSRR